MAMRRRPQTEHEQEWRCWSLIFLRTVSFSSLIRPERSFSGSRIQNSRMRWRSSSSGMFQMSEPVPLPPFLCEWEDSSSESDSRWRGSWRAAPFLPLAAAVPAAAVLVALPLALVLVAVAVLAGAALAAGAAGAAAAGAAALAAGALASWAAGAALAAGWAAA